jgi:hypothetical protein
LLSDTPDGGQNAFSTAVNLGEFKDETILGNTELPENFGAACSEDHRLVAEYEGVQFLPTTFYEKRRAVKTESSQIGS